MHTDMGLCTDRQKHRNVHTHARTQTETHTYANICLTFPAPTQTETDTVTYTYIAHHHITTHHQTSPSGGALGHSTHRALHDQKEGSEMLRGGRYLSGFSLTSPRALGACDARGCGRHAVQQPAWLTARPRSAVSDVQLASAEVQRSVLASAAVPPPQAPSSGLGRAEELATTNVLRRLPFLQILPLLNVSTHRLCFHVYCLHDIVHVPVCTFPSRSLFNVRRFTSSISCLRS